MIMKKSDVLQILFFNSIQFNSTLFKKLRYAIHIVRHTAR